MTKPLTPSEVLSAKRNQIPDAVIEAFNKLLSQDWDGESAIINQDTLIKEIQSIDPTLVRDKLFANKWLDIEDLYRANGWKVVYDKPGYNESYQAFWAVSKKE